MGRRKDLFGLSCAHVSYVLSIFFLLGLPQPTLVLLRGCVAVEGGLIIKVPSTRCAVVLSQTWQVIISLELELLPVPLLLGEVILDLIKVAWSTPSLYGLFVNFFFFALFLEPGTRPMLTQNSETSPCNPSALSHSTSTMVVYGNNSEFASK